MPRIRTIKPQFWLDENLGQVPRDVRLLYIGLWNLADDTGVFQWRPSQIKVQLFPYDTDIDSQEIEAWLQMLVKTKDIERIEKNNKVFGRVITFLTHQSIKNPSEWTFLDGDSSTPALPQPAPSSTPALPLGKRNREKDKGIGNREDTRTNKKPYGQFNNVYLSDDEYKKLSSRFDSSCQEKIEELSEALSSRKGYAQRFTNHYATILSWDRREQKKGGQNGTHKQDIGQSQTTSVERLKAGVPKRFLG